MLMHLLAQNGREWFSASKHLSKPSAILQSLPDELRDLIETEKGKGYRLRTK
jgi:hypothetical protein